MLMCISAAVIKNNRVTAAVGDILKAFVLFT